MKPFLVGENDDTTCATLAERLGLQAGATRVALHRLRQRYQKLFREAVAQTVASEAELEEELQHVFRVLSS